MQNEFWAELKEINQLTKDTYQVSFSYEHNFEFSPGQYVWIVLPQLLYPDVRGERRAFSITSSSSEKNSLTILFRSSESGYKRTLLSYQSGTKVKIIGPFGSSYVPSPEYKKVIMIAGGVGIAPFLSILRSYSPKIDETKYAVIYLNKSSESGVCNDELTALTSINNFSYVDQFGTLNENLFPVETDFANDIFFICGGTRIVDESYSILTKKGVPIEHMRFEQNYPSNADNLTEADFKVQENGENFMLQAVQDSKNHVIITDINGRIIFANIGAQKNTGYTLDEMRGNTPRLWGGLMPVTFYKKFWSRKHQNAGFDGEMLNRRKNGEQYYVLAHISPIKHRNGNIIGYIGTEEDITKEKQIDQAKTEFISLASHQLRTPLSTINWYCELLLAGDAGKITDEQNKFVGEAYHASQRMAKLVNALLNVSRIEMGTFMVSPENVNLVKLTRSVLDESKPQIDDKELSVELINEELPEIQLDPNLTTIILQNLLTNAIKYTPPKGHITVLLRQIMKGKMLNGQIVGQDSLLITVEDTGIGIPNTQQSQIFQKLFRADNAKDSNNDGTGLGLYLVKSLIEHSQGKIWFTSGEGKGSSFFVLLPFTGMTKKEGDKQLV